MNSYPGPQLISILSIMEKIFPHSQKHLLSSVLNRYYGNLYAAVDWIISTRSYDRNLSPIPPARVGTSSFARVERPGTRVGEIGHYMGGVCREIGTSERCTCVLKEDGRHYEETCDENDQGYLNEGGGK